MFKKVKKQLAALVYYSIIVIVKLFPVRSKDRHLLLIKTDEIGDYILFRSYLKYFKLSPVYKHHTITLVGNAAWREIYELYDKDSADNVIWVQKGRLKKDLKYRFELFLSLRKLQVSDVINCIFSRDMLIDDGMAHVATGNNKTAMKGDDTNRGPNGKNEDHKIYTNIIDAGGQPVFDAIRNCNYVKTVLAKNNIPVSTKIEAKKFDHKLSQKYYVMFLGAGNPERKWPAGHFLAIAGYVNERYGLIPVLCGGPPDQPDAEYFIQAYKKEVLNYTNKTTLPDLIGLLNDATFLISVDTGALHIAAAVQCPVAGLYSGKFYGRFAPYPTEITAAFFPVYPDFVDELIAARDPVLYDTFIMKNDTIKKISVDKVKIVIDNMMQTSTP